MPRASARPAVPLMGQPAPPDSATRLRSLSDTASSGTCSSGASALPAGTSLTPRVTTRGSSSIQIEGCGGTSATAEARQPIALSIRSGMGSGHCTRPRIMWPSGPCAGSTSSSELRSSRADSERASNCTTMASVRAVTPHARSTSDHGSVMPSVADTLGVVSTSTDSPSSINRCVACSSACSAASGSRLRRSSGGSTTHARRCALRAAGRGACEGFQASTRKRAARSASAMNAKSAPAAVASRGDRCVACTNTTALRAAPCAAASASTMAASADASPSSSRQAGMAALPLPVLTTSTGGVRMAAATSPSRIGGSRSIPSCEARHASDSVTMRRAASRSSRDTAPRPSVSAPSRSSCAHTPSSAASARPAPSTSPSGRSGADAAAVSNPACHCAPSAVPRCNAASNACNLAAFGSPCGRAATACASGADRSPAPHTASSVASAFANALFHAPSAADSLAVMRSMACAALPACCGASRSTSMMMGAAPDASAQPRARSIAERAAAAAGSPTLFATSSVHCTGASAALTAFCRASEALRRSS